MPHQLGTANLAKVPFGGTYLDDGFVPGAAITVQPKHYLFMAALRDADDRFIAVRLSASSTSARF
jgi:hypothetical protein